MALAGPYCSVCGQKADVRILSLARLLADAIGDLFNFDSRIWRSLLTLAFKPGRLTHLYLEGQRARYTPPFRMYIVTSVVFFLILSLARPEEPAPPEIAPGTSIDDTIDAAVDDADIALEPAEPAAPDAAVSEAAEPGAATEDDGFNVEVDGGGNWLCSLDSGMSRRLRTQFEPACRKLVDDGGESFGRAFADNLSVMMLVFIPAVAAIMKVLYPFARRKYVEHLLFFLHVHTLFFLIAVLAVIFDFAARRVPVLNGPIWFVNTALWIYFPVYLFMAMRYVYGQNYALTSVKYVALGGSYFVAFMFMLLSMIVYTALTL
jgi:hypothetical protein